MHKTRKISKSINVSKHIKLQTRDLLKKITNAPEISDYDMIVTYFEIKTHYHSKKPH